MAFEEARAILEMHCRRLDHKIASTNIKAEGHPRSGATERAWWLANAGTTPDWRNARTVAYLSAYVEIADQPRFPMQGIRLDDGYLWPDRAVIRTLLLNECLAVEGGDFCLTRQGQALVAPRLRIDGGKVTVTGT
jgi:hypothetical protein